MKYKKGDKVIIRDWLEMECDHGLLAGNIDIKPYGFCEEMERDLKGKSRKAKIVHVGLNYYHVRLEWRLRRWRCKDWTRQLTDEMLKPAKIRGIKIKSLLKWLVKNCLEVQ